MTIQTCPTCGEYRFFPLTSNHGCPPGWQILCDDISDPSNPETVYSHTADGAAKKYAEQNFSNMDYPSEMEIRVRSNARKMVDKWQIFCVTIEAEPVFSTTEVESNDESVYPLPEEHL